MRKLSMNRVKDYAKINILKKTDPEYTGILENLDSTKEELDMLNQSLNYITDPILVNQIIFQIKAAEVRYRYWFYLARNKAKEKNNEEMQTNV